MRAIFPCKEFEPISIPLDVLTVKGEFKFYPESERFFDVDYRNGRIVLAPKSFVGLIPVNDKVSIHVLPRFPISNLFHILHRSSATLKFIEGYTRTYSVGHEDPERDPIELLAERLVHATKGVRQSGLLRRYVTHQSDSAPVGAIDISQTVSRFRAAGVKHRQVWSNTEHSVQLPENQLIKSALSRLLSYFANHPHRSDARIFAIREALYLFDPVFPATDQLRITENELANMVKRLPASHREFGYLMWLAYLIHSQRGIFVEKIGSASFETFVVNMADVFEDYVRNIIASSAAVISPGSEVKDGNTHQVKLFVDSEKHKVKPDIYLRRDGKNVAVLDAKYKPSLKAADRYEVLAFCEALNVKKAVLISPSDSHENSHLIGTTPNGVEMWSTKINLAAEDIAGAEREFMEAIRSALH